MNNKTILQIKKISITILSIFFVLALSLYLSPKKVNSASSYTFAPWFNSWDSPFVQKIPSYATYTKTTEIGSIRPNYWDYSMSVYVIPSSSGIPLVKVVNRYSGRTEYWPVPTWAKPTTTSDVRMTVLDRNAGISYELWDMKWVNSGEISAGGFKDFPVKGNGISNPTYRRVTAAGFASTAGMVLRDDFVDPVTGTLDKYRPINHALSMSIPGAILLKDGYIPPAVGGEAAPDGVGTIPMGARYALPRNIDIESLQVHPLTKSIARALKEYGVFIGDRNNAPTYNNTYVGTFRLQEGTAQEVFGESHDSIMNTVQSEMFTIIKNYGLYEITGINYSNWSTPTPTVQNQNPTPTPVSSLTCPPAGNVAGGIATMTVNLGQTGNYKAWVNMKGQGDNANTFWLQVDNLYCSKVGDLAGMPVGVWTWVDYENGNEQDKIPMPLLGAGSHTIKLIGNAAEPGVSVDNIILTTDLNCIPSGNGDNCIGVVSTPTPTKIPEVSTPTPTKTPVVSTPTPTKAPVVSTPTPTKAPVVSTPTPSPIVGGTTIKLLPIADTYVRKSSPNTVDGKNSILKISGPSSGDITYLKFDLTPLNGKTITGAYLYFYITNGSNATQSVHSVANTSWDEYKLTYNTKPDLGFPVTTIKSNNISGKWYSINLTSYVQNNTGKVVSFGMQSQDGDALWFNSKESSRPMYLNVVVQ